MNTDIRIHIEFWSHAKTRRMIRTLGLQGPVSLQILWCYAAKNRTDGVLSKMDATDIEEAAGWPAERAGDFFRYCTRNGWLDKAARGTYRIHEWHEYNPWAAEAASRREDGKRGAHERHHVQKGVVRKGCGYCREANPEDVAPLKPPYRETNAPSPAPAPSPNPSPAPVATPAVVLPADGLSALEVIRGAVKATNPRLDADDFTVSRWLRDFNADPWVIAAAILEAGKWIAQAGTIGGVRAVVEKRALANDWTAPEIARPYVEHQLSRVARTGTVEVSA